MFVGLQVLCVCVCVCVRVFARSFVLRHLCIFAFRVFVFCYCVNAFVCVVRCVGLCVCVSCVWGLCFYACVYVFTSLCYLLPPILFI